MARLVVLVEGVCSPEYPVAVRAGILLVSLMELILMSLPVKFTFKFGVASVSEVRRAARGVGGTRNKLWNETHDVHQYALVLAEGGLLPGSSWPGNCVRVLDLSDKDVAVVCVDRKLPLDPE